VPLAEMAAGGGLSFVTRESEPKGGDGTRLIALGPPRDKAD
jgi:hypothetical protein